ncbi:MAG: hypothetical protein ACI4JS_06490 [Oscillospiraceae bacterium]
MAFNVDKAKVQLLNDDMKRNYSEIRRLLGEMAQLVGKSKIALGDDYENIAKNIMNMSGFLENAEEDLNNIISKTEQYIDKVGQIEVTLHNL